MGTIHVHLFTSYDGVVENPAWTFEYGFDPKMGEELAEITDGSEAILLGRKTYEMFEPAWSTRTVEDDPGAPFFNETVKYVVSSTLTDPTWNNSQVITLDEVAALKERTGGKLYISGSVQLVQALLDQGLIDGLHLFNYPIALGAGLRLFPDDGPTRKLSLESSRVYDNGVVYTHYRPLLQ